MIGDGALKLVERAMEARRGTLAGASTSVEAIAGGGQVPFGRRTGRSEGATRSFVNRLLRLTLLAPDIIEAILDGGQPKGLQLEELTGAMPSAWEEQQHRFTFERFAK